jgi:hypothetical protein
MSALGRVALRPERKYLHLNREYAVVINMKGLAFIVFIWLIDVTFLSKIRQMYLPAL